MCVSESKLQILHCSLLKEEPSSKDNGAPTGTMSNESFPLSKRLRKTQEQVAFPEGSKTALILTRLIDEVAAPLDESNSVCQKLLDGSGSKLSQDLRKSVETLAANSALASRRLRDYVDLLRLEGGELSLRPKTFNLEDVIQLVAKNQKAAARAKGLGFVVDPPVRPLPAVLADPGRLGQVLSDLVANAIKFTERGQVTISTELYDRSIVIHVVDTGVGIPSAQLPRIFAARPRTAGTARTTRTTRTTRTATVVWG
jgi:signal transduction histidine kinase